MANYEQLQNDYPELAAMFQALQDGIQRTDGAAFNDQPLWDVGLCDSRWQLVSGRPR